MAEPRQFSVFIAGETMDLCVPNRSALDHGWSDWSNDEATTEYLVRGVYPNLVEQQERFYNGLVDGSRLAAFICDKSGTDLWGIISLSNIDLVARSAEIALVLPVGRKRHPFAALEAMARTTEHGFLKLGLERIWAGQAHPGLRKWNQRLELLGYRTEGVLRRGFAKGRVISDTVLISVLYEDYWRIAEARRFWPGSDAVKTLLRRLPPQSLADRLADSIRREQEAYYTENDWLFASPGEGSPGQDNA